MSDKISRLRIKDSPHGTSFSQSHIGDGGGGGNGMDDVLKRLGSVESNVADIRAKVSGIEATLPHLATKADLTTGIGSLQTLIAKTELSIIKWVVVTAIALTTLAFAIARYVAPA